MNVQFKNTGVIQIKLIAEFNFVQLFKGFPEVVGTIKEILRTYQEFTVVSPLLDKVEFIHRFFKSFVYIVQGELEVLEPNRCPLRQEIQKGLSLLMDHLGLYVGHNTDFFNRSNRQLILGIKSSDAGRDPQQNPDQSKR